MNDMPPPLPVHPWQAARDAGHLKLLSIFHFILAGLGGLGLGFLGLHGAMMSLLFAQATSPGHGPPPELKLFVIGFYGVFACVVLVFITGNVLAGLWIRKRKNRILTFIVAGLNCLQVPLGTTLGVFTFLVLGRASVRAIYRD